MRTSTLIATFVQATLFLGLGVRCIKAWLDTRDNRSAHLATATSLFGINSLLSAISQAIWNTDMNEQPPLAWGIISSIVIFLAALAFLVFLADFIRFHVVLKVLAITATAFNIVMSIIERPDVSFKLTEKGFEQVPIPGVHNIISYHGYLWYVIIWLAVVFGVLAVSFLVYGFRVDGLARFRMMSIGGGFALLFVAIGLLPLLIFGDVSRSVATNMLNVVRYLALVSAPLLFMGFAPPKRIAERIGRPASASAG